MKFKFKDQLDKGYECLDTKVLIKTSEEDLLWLLQRGYVRPEELLTDSKQIEELKKAVDLITDFENQLPDRLVEYI